MADETDLTQSSCLLKFNRGHVDDEEQTTISLVDDQTFLVGDQRVSKDDLNDHLQRLLFGQPSPVDWASAEFKPDPNDISTSVFVDFTRYRKFNKVEIISDDESIAPNDEINFRSNPADGEAFFISMLIDLIQMNG